MLGYDPESDRHRYQPEVHYRLYQGREGPTVICVQDFDYPDYDTNLFLSNRSFTTEDDARAALRLLMLDAATILGIAPGFLSIT